ncbi:hypothetical protein F2Q68_00024656 [Brassica cretica]|uniref:Uncharacterized protein n=1 Tax=Brassica cretica TaxID=69181 RepID=A0A8S9ID85_BRACR|nr:hypothetical protein F2Q68_00024656 [Brassica cretica]
MKEMKVVGMGRSRVVRLGLGLVNSNQTGQNRRGTYLDRLGSDLEWSLRVAENASDLTWSLRHVDLID